MYLTTMKKQNHVYVCHKNCSSKQMYECSFLPHTLRSYWLKAQKKTYTVQIRRWKCIYKHHNVRLAMTVEELAWCISDPIIASVDFAYFCCHPTAGWCSVSWACHPMAGSCWDLTYDCYAKQSSEERIPKYGLNYTASTKKTKKRKNHVNGKWCAYYGDCSTSKWHTCIIIVTMYVWYEPTFSWFCKLFALGIIAWSKKLTFMHLDDVSRNKKLMSSSCLMKTWWGKNNRSLSVTSDKLTLLRNLIEIQQHQRVNTHWWRNLLIWSKSSLC